MLFILWSLAVGQNDEFGAQFWAESPRKSLKLNFARIQKSKRPLLQVLDLEEQKSQNRHNKDGLFFVGTALEYSVLSSFGVTSKESFLSIVNNGKALSMTVLYAYM